MSLLNSLFDTDEIELIKVNKKFFKILIIMLLLIIFSLLIKKTNYYSNTFTISDKKALLLVEKDYINEINNNKKIIIDNIENEYSIEKITPSDDIYIVKVKLKTKIDIKSGVYKIYLGKESLFDYIFRIIKK